MMATRFLIIIRRCAADLERPRRAARQLGLYPVLEADRLQVFVDGTDVIPFADDRGAILGHLFSRTNVPATILALAADEAAAAMRTKGQTLIERFWGSYVAVLDPLDGAEVHVVRDPSAGTPCFFVDKPEAVIVGSEASDVLYAAGVRPEVDWSAVARQLLGQDMPADTTALLGLQELNAGKRLSVSAEKIRTQTVWTPWDFVNRRKPDRGAIDPAPQLRHVVESCVGAWGSRFKHALLSVSGGLDSSIVAAALARNGRDFSCFTHSTIDAAGDERVFARRLTDALGVHLTEVFFEPTRVDVLKTAAPDFPRPIAHMLGQETLRASLEIGRARGADAYFTGVGGDNVFCSVRSASVIVDRMKVGDVGGALGTLGDLCRLTDCSVWDAAGRAAAKFMSGAHTYRQNRHEDFLSQAAIKQHGEWRPHPWLTSPHRLPGKAVHVAYILRSQNLLGAWPRGQGSKIAPLLSQPIIEACLSIPTWSWCEGGRDRAVARRAFADRLPPEIINRRSKGTPAAAAVQVYERNRGNLVDILSSGHLAREGILDVTSAVQALEDPRPPQARTYARLLQLADIEAWARGWRERRMEQPPKGGSEAQPMDKELAGSRGGNFQKVAGK